MGRGRGVRNADGDEDVRGGGLGVVLALEVGCADEVI